MAYKSTILADNPIAYWTLGDNVGSNTAVDSGPNNLNATVVGTVTFGSAALLSANNGTSVQITSSGTNGFNVPYTSVFNFTGDYTFETWVKTSDTSNQVWFALDNKYLGIIGSKCSISGIVGNTTITDGNPHHLVVTSRSGLISIFVDGNLDNTPSAYSPGYSSIAPSIGYFAAVTGLPLDGYIEHLAIYNYSLTNAKITSHYNAKNSSDAFGFVQNLSDVTFITANQAKITARQPSGGSGNYTYKWYMDTNTNFSPSSSNLVSGQISQTATFSNLVTNVNNWVVCGASDGSNTIYSFHRLLKSPNLVPLRVGILGDSTTVINNPSHTMGLYLQTLLGDRQVTINNQGVSGTLTSQWVQNGALMTAALQSFASGGMVAGDFVSVRLGTNESQNHADPNAYKTSLISVCAALNNAGYNVMLNYPIWREAGIFYEITSYVFDELTTPYLLAYQGVIDSLVNNTSIFAGDRVGFFNSAMNPSRLLNRSDSLPGAIHPSVDGGAAMGINEGYALYNILYHVQSQTPTPTPTPTGTNTNPLPNQTIINHGGFINNLFGNASTGRK